MACKLRVANEALVVHPGELADSLFRLKTALSWNTRWVDQSEILMNLIAVMGQVGSFERSGLLK